MKAAKKALALLLSVLMLYGFGAGTSAEEPEEAETQAYALQEADDDLEDLDDEPQAYALREADDELEDLDDGTQEDVPPEPTQPTWWDKLKDGFKFDRYELFILFLWPLIFVLGLSDSIFGHYFGMIPFLISLPITLPVSLVLGIVTLPILLLLRSFGLGIF